MKRVIIKLSRNLCVKDLKALRDSLDSDWREGFMVLPEFCSLEFVDQEWIDATKMIPKPDNKVLCYVEVLNYGKESKEYAVGWLHEGYWQICLGDEEIDDVEVLAWMPLPLPYEV